MKIAQMMQQAQEMQSRFQSMQDQLNEQDVEGAAGGGLVRVRISLKGDVREIKIDPELLKPDEVEVLEDLLKAAFAQARARASEMLEQQTSKMMADLGLPAGFKLPFGSM